MVDTSEGIQTTVRFLTERGDEIRRRLIWSVIVIVAAAIAGYSLVPWTLHMLTVGMPKAVYLVPADALKAHLTIAITLGIIISLPFLEWQIMRLATPYLPKNYRRLGYALIPTSMFLFLAGIWFSYIGAYAFAMRFFLGYHPTGINPSWTITSIVSFALALFIPSGIVFEAPIIFYFLAKAGIVKPQMLSGNWKIVLFVLFIIASVITPSPEVISTSIMFFPITFMYLLSIVIVKAVWRGKEKRRAEAENA